MEVLICVGDSFGARGLELLLNQLCGGARIRRVQDPEEALENAGSGKGTVIVTSLGAMPGGLDSLNAYFRKEGSPGLLVLAPTDTPPSVLVRCVGPGRGFLLEGAHPDLLRQAVEALAEGKSFAEPTLLHALIGELAMQSNSASAIRFVDPEGRLPARIRRVVLPAAYGYSDREIAEQLSLSEATIRGYLHEAYDLLRISGRKALVQRYQEGLRSNTQRRHQPEGAPVLQYAR